MKTLSLALAALSLAFVTGCKDKSAGTTAGNAMAKMSEFRDRMCGCKDAACARDVSEEMTAWAKQSNDKPGAMSAEEQKQATEIGTQLGECMMKATGLGGDATGSASASATGSGAAGATTGSAEAAGSAASKETNAQGLPKACDDYKAAVEKLRTCDKLAVQARETLIKGYEDAAARWATASEETKASLAEACTGGLEAITSVGKAQCGW